MPVTLTDNQVNAIIIAVLFVLPVLIIFAAFILRAATAWITKIRISLWLAIGISAIVGVLSTLVAIPIQIIAHDIGPFAQIPTLVVAFFTSAFTSSMLIRRDTGRPIGFAKGALITLAVSVLVGTVLAILALAFLPQFKLS